MENDFVHTLLFVDDEPLALDASKEFFEKRGFKVDTASSGPQAVALLKANPDRYSVAIVDYQMEGCDGAATTEALLDVAPHLSVIIYSADPALEAFLRPHRSGARTYVSKQEEVNVLLRTVRRLCKEYEAKHLAIDETLSAEENEKVIASVGMVGRSVALAKIARIILKLRETRGPVLVLGESGVGKELVANALHDPKRGPYVAVNCADYLLNPATLRSELFGHVRGSFTGAAADKKGLLEEAGEGTVFLDEIDTLPLDAQVGLLRALEARVVTPMGSSRQVPIRCRVIASAKPDLSKQVSAGAFKQDLFHRINENIIFVPALSERPDDIGPLVVHFCRQWSKLYGTDKKFLATTVSYLERYSWPGNARDLRNIVFSTLNLSEKTRIAPSDVDERFHRLLEASSSTESSGTLKSDLALLTRDRLIEALEVSVSYREAGRRLGIAASTVLKYIKKYGIDGEGILGSKRAAVGKKARR